MTKPTNSEFKEIFNIIAPSYNKVSNSYLVDLRKNIFGNWAKGKCLEVGAGTGEISRFLSKKHAVVATDISPGMVQEIEKGGIEAITCDAEKLPFENNSFDTIVAAEMLFYLDNPDNFLSEAHRILKPEGQLLISCASNFPVKLYDRLRSWLRRLGFREGMYFDEDPLREFMTVQKLRTMLEQHHFKTVEERRTPIFPLVYFKHLNDLLEKTVLKYFGIFFFILTKKHI